MVTSIGDGDREKFCLNCNYIGNAGRIVSCMILSAILKSAGGSMLTCLCCIQHFVGAAVTLPWGKGNVQFQRVHLVLCP